MEIHKAMREWVLSRRRVTASDIAKRWDLTEDEAYGVYDQLKVDGLIGGKGKVIKED